MAREERRPLLECDVVVVSDSRLVVLPTGTISSSSSANASSRQFSSESAAPSRPVAPALPVSSDESMFRGSELRLLEVTLRASSRWLTLLGLGKPAGFFSTVDATSLPGETRSRGEVKLHVLRGSEVKLPVSCGGEFIISKLYPSLLASSSMG